MSIVLLEVISTKDKKNFHSFSRVLYADDEYYISHIDQDIEAIFNPDKNSEFEQGDAKRWLAYSDGNIVGKLAAFYSQKSHVAGIGFFDSINSQEVANAMFDTGIQWLKEEGYNRVEAPINFGERDKYWGLLVEGFQHPAYQENFNFPYYKALFENYGFQKTIEQTTSEARPEGIDFDKYKRFSDRLQERSGLRAEHFKVSEMDRFVRDFTLVYNQAWQQHEHYVPFSESRVKALFTEMKPIIREDILWFLYDGDKPVGFYLSIIDLNQIFKHVNGNMNWWGKLKFFYYLKTVKMNKVRGIIFGVVPEYQNKGVYSIMIMKMFEIMQKDRYIQSTELAWIGDFNPKMHALFDSLNAHKVKVHYTFEKLY
jgi:hypothetical protein